jgi:2-(1,2-epoxy-1,2-dihydrophenyl)acetyl-CoA isomerase
MYFAKGGILMYSGYNTIAVEIEENLCTLTLNRPDKRNAINETMLEELIDFLAKAKDDSNVRALVITGAGKGFSAGADVGEWEAEDPEEADWVGKGHRMMLALKDLPKPVIAAVNGVAVGAGCDMALAADVRFGSSYARFGQAYIKVGYCPDNGGTYLLPRIVGWGKATEMIFTGDIVEADEAHRIGILNHLTTPENLLAEATAFAKRLAEGPTVAIAQAKINLNKSWLLDFEAELEEERKGGDICHETEDNQEALKAFVEKRKPVYKGR